MSIAETEKIDWMGATEKGKCLTLCIYDHFDWEDEEIHLLMLQDKINTYLAFLESGQWKQYVPKRSKFKYTTIEIRFKYDITKNCEKFLQVVQDQVGQMGVLIRGVIAE